MIDQRSQFDRFRQLGQPDVAARLLGALRSKGDSDPVLRANLLRRAGDLHGAREHYQEAGLEGLEDPACVIPPRLFSCPGFAVPPLYVIDDFLQPEQMAKLYAGVCSREDQFVHAKSAPYETESQVGLTYDSSRRESFFLTDFGPERAFFSDYIFENIGRMSKVLALPEWDLSKSEVRATNYCEGGFFELHRDNHRPFAEAGRAISWLYYFGPQEPLFSGGELYCLDSAARDGGASQDWFTTIIPRPNRFVAFPSWAYHGVAPAKPVLDTFASGRMAIGGHVWKKAGFGLGWWE